jgi:hypothetical protein
VINAYAMADNPIKHSEIIQPGNPFKDTIKGLEKMIKLLKEAAKDYLQFAQKQNIATKEGRKNIQAVAQATQQLSVKEKEALKIKQQLEREQAKLNLMSSKEYKDLIKTKEAARAKNAELRNTAKAMRTGVKSTNTWGKALGSFAFKFNALGNIASNVASKLTRVFNRAVRGAMSTIMEFEQSMADVRSVANATDKEFKALSKSARDLGGSTKFTAIEVAKLQKELAKLGFSTEEILNAQAATLDLAAATNTDLARAAEVSAITIRQFGLDASETQRVVDVMAKSFSTSALDMEKFAESMKFVGPVAKAAGLSVEQTTARLAQMADAGISGSMGGTALRQIFLQLAKDGKAAAAGIEELSMSELGLAEASEAVKQRAATALLVLADGVDTVDDFALSLDNAAGAAKKMADIQLDTLQGKITILKSAWDRYILSLASSEEEFLYLKAVLDGTSIGLNNMSDKVEGNKEEATKFNTALRNLWQGVKLSIPVWGQMANQQQQIENRLIENKKAADELKESFDDLSLSVGGVSGFFADDDDEKVKINTLAALGEQMRKLKEDRDNASFSEITAINDEINALQQKIDNYKKYGTALPPISEVKEWVDEEFNLLEGLFETTKNKEAETLAFQREQRAKFRAEDKKQREKAKREEAEAEKEKQQKIQATFDLANRLTTTFTDLFASQKAKELSAAGDNAEKRAEIEKKYARREQALALGQAIVDGAASILKTKAQLGLPAAIPFMIADAALTAAQIGIIASQKFEEGGPVIGERHSRGGVHIEAEDGEYVINRKSTARYSDLIQAINANDQTAIANAALQNQAFHEVWGRTKVKEVPVDGSDPWTRKMYELMKETPVAIPKDVKEIHYPGHTRIYG